MAESVGDMTARLLIDVLSDQAQQRVKQFANVTRSSMGNVEANLRVARIATQKFNEKWQDTIRLSRQAGMALTAVGIAVAAVGRLAVNAAADAEETQSKFDAVFKDQAATVRVWAAEQAKAINRSKYVFEDYLSRLQDTFVPMGLAREEAAKLSKQVTTLAMDLSSFNNIAEDEALDRLQSALVGNHRTVRMFGVMISDVTLKAELFRMGLQGGTKAATEQQKMVARLNIIVRSTADAQGDAARTAGSMTNQLRGAQALIKELSVTVGKALVPTLQQLMPLFNGVVKWLTAVSETESGRALIVLAGGFGAVSLALGPLLIVLPTIVSQLAALPATAAAAWAAITSPAGMVVIAIGAVTVAILAMTGALERARRRAREQAAAAKLAAEQWNTEQLKAFIKEQERALEIQEKVLDGLLKQWSEWENILGGMTLGMADPQKELRDQIARTRERMAEAEANIKAATDAITDLGAAEAVTADATGKLQQKTKELTKAEKDARKAALELAGAHGDLIRDTLRGLDESRTSVIDATTAISEAWQQSVESVTAAQDRYQEAVAQSQRVQEDAAERVEDAQERLADAHERLADVRESVATRAEEAAQRVEDAELKAAEAVMTAQQRAVSQVERAQKRLKDLLVQRWLKAQPKDVQEQYRAYQEQQRINEAQQAIEKARQEGALAIAKAREQGGEQISKAQKARENAGEAGQKQIATAEKSVEQAREQVANALEQQTEAAEQCARREQEALNAITVAYASAGERIAKAVEQRGNAIESLARTVEAANTAMIASYGKLAEVQRKAGIPVATAPPSIQGPLARPVPGMPAGGGLPTGTIVINFNAPVYGDEGVRQLAQEEIHKAVAKARTR